ncbi:MAG: hypothetical protein IPL52_03960 [Flavobacteriales bacterium]|nr:hypothetical protein [Flavobacteriales bacterium]
MNKYIGLLIGLFAITSTAAFAQYNEKGRIHLSIGGAAGVHATELEAKITLLGVTFTETSTDGAGTTSLPIQIGAALANRFTLGFLLEPGRYLPDSADADTQTNGFFHFAIEPKFYLINGERVAWTASLQVGGIGLHIQDDTPGKVVDARLSGTAFGIGTGFVYALGDHVGLGFDLRYMTTNMEIRAIEVNDASITDFYGGTLRTAGVVAQLSLAFRFGGD